MSFLGFGADYEKAGSGVAKNAPKKKPFFLFMEMYFGRFWKMTKLSLLTFLCALPLVTLGPALAGMTKVLRGFVLDKDVFLGHEFFKGFRRGWKKSLIVGLADILFGVSLVCALYVYPDLAKQAEAGGASGTPFTVFCVISVSFALTVLMMNFYALPMIVATDLGFKDIIKNSFYLVCLGLKKNIITLLIVLLTVGFIVICAFVSQASLLLVPLWATGFLGFVIIFNSYPLIQKYVIDPFYAAKGEDNPEYDFLKPLDDSGAVFTDMGGKEAPVEGKKKDGGSPKGKIIS